MNLVTAGGYTFTPWSQAALSKWVPILTQAAVDGYARNAPIGRELMGQGITSNLDLSPRRADGVANCLIRQGVIQNIVSDQGHGEAVSAEPDGRAKNRRVEVTLRQRT